MDGLSRLDEMKELSMEAYKEYISTGLRHVELLPKEWPSNWEFVKLSGVIHLVYSASRMIGIQGILLGFYGISEIRRSEHSATNDI